MSQLPGWERLDDGDGRADPGGTGAGVERFVLDLGSNPHPVMLRRALAHRNVARSFGASDAVIGYWQGYLAAMVDATGCAQSDLLDWLDRHEGDA